MRQWRDSQPTIIEAAEGFHLIDTDGHRYIDGFSSLWCNVHGHRVPEIDQAIRDQLDRVAHSTMLGLASVPAIHLAERLVGIAPGEMRVPGAETKVFYSDAGATATELAFKMAIGFWHHTGQPQRNTLIGISGAYHGDTTGAMSVGYSAYFHRPFQRMTFQCAWAPAPDVCHPDPHFNIRPLANPARDWPSRSPERREACVSAALHALEMLLEQTGDRCAAIVIEPLMQGAAGMIEQPEGYLRGVAELARRHGVLLIADEVATGFGRTGEMFACDVENVTPDILCVAKGLSAGYLPLAATLCRNTIAEAFEGDLSQNRTLYHGHTFTGNPLACAAALASLDLFNRNEVLDNARANAGRITAALSNLLDHPHVLDVRQRGLMTGIELTADRQQGRPFSPEAQVPHRLCLAMRAAGLMIRPLGNVVIFMPAPAMNASLLDEALDIITRTWECFDFAEHL